MVLMSESGSPSIVGTLIQARGPGPGPVARQGSIYNLTLDEVQNKLGDLGKPLGSMNLDEFIEKVEANSSRAAAEGVGYDHLSSGVRISGDLSKKTVEEVWRSIDRTGTYGKMTLEDFLFKAGVVTDSSPGKEISGSGNEAGVAMGMPHQGQWMNYSMPLNHHHPQVILPFDVPGRHETQVAFSSSPLMGPPSNTTQTPRRKRVAPDDVAEKSVERRQKRMIKNRESAARSRARKQAYTNELENKIMRLEEENERLRRLQELEKALPCIPPPQQPKNQLRRTSSAPL
ncbi:ABSCISIC ACID-INSENSITIVE 5-like protein 2 [Andrographis paniculata]|uniref:ABSCISIC ACID-INSENSITIVE 5-like protein 2 n=1 Tax=Andrographis paniculata TaxID=175694 RepID=UPI0021E85EB4|nr:ABSCISIC ACID-INSENSITIVE 5-like protein 2 [Andrographis paniculata]XP_051142053.1 ABSCISIC ACID-INSENSITIVE 5-like protein 2 [Andrographis paniculata]XP_051142060.1 ABSCISIC ACID-INSENSITIVE 5-like protein 2 [Andrographis paniculata]